MNRYSLTRTCLSLLLLSIAAAVSPTLAQQPTPDQARAALLRRPDLGVQLQGYLARSGLTEDQIRSRLATAGYSPDLFDGYIPGTTPTTQRRPQSTSQLLAAARALGIMEAADEPPPEADTVRGRPGQDRMDLTEPGPSKSRIFGLDVFNRVTSQFQPALSGPVDPSYRLGPGDMLVLILTGDVELAHTLEVTREGGLIIPQVGNLFVSGLTLQQLNELLYDRLGRVYSGVRRQGGTTRFQVTVARLRTNQIFVVGEVYRPGSYQVSSAGTVLSALYVAGGPTAGGSFRKILIRRAGRTVDSLDLYAYLLRGDNTHDIRLETGDVIFVPVHGLRAEIVGMVNRPAIYELGTGSKLTDLLAAAGGFTAFAQQQRIQIDRVLPPAERQTGGRDRVILDLSADQIGSGTASAFPLQSGDVVTVFEVTDRRRNMVTVEGAVWREGKVGFLPGMRISDAIRLAGGPKPDFFQGQMLISRLNPDSTRTQLHARFRDSTGAVIDDMALREDDNIRVFSRTTFRQARSVSISGAVRAPGQYAFREGMTLRDAVLEASGLTEDALIGEVEIARLPDTRETGALATAIFATIDSSFVFDRGPDERSLGPPGLPGPGSSASEFLLRPYDNILIRRQPEWELHRMVTVNGSVSHPGTYPLRSRSERVSQLFARVGGLGREAYPRGALLFRIQDESRLVASVAFSEQVSSPLTKARAAPGDSTTNLNKARVGTTNLTKARVGIDLAKALAAPGSHYDLILKAGDSLWVPEYDPTVQVVGAVNAPTRVVFRSDWHLNDYVVAAGGFLRVADKDRSYLLQPGGQVESQRRRFLLPDSRVTPEPGSTIFVPVRGLDDRRDWVGLLGSIAQILASTVALIVVATR